MSEEILVAVVAGPRPRARLTAALVRDGIPPMIEADTIDGLVSQCADRRPHVVVHAGGGEPGAPLRRLARSIPRTRLVAVVPGTDRTAIREALQAGADGVVVADDVPVTLAVTVRAVWSGQTAVPNGARAALGTAALSPREREVFELVAAGLSNAAIAERLCLTEHTVKSHLGSMFTKLGVHSRSEAIALHARRHARFGSPATRRVRAGIGDLP
jgi:DNA-binding NarL/FixJ family response regulator